MRSALYDMAIPRLSNFLVARRLRSGAFRDGPVDECKRKADWIKSKVW